MNAPDRIAVSSARGLVSKAEWRARVDLSLIPHALAEETARSFPWMESGTPASEMDWPNLLARVEAHGPGYRG